jgi:hypothetical protein
MLMHMYELLLKQEGGNGGRVQIVECEVLSSNPTTSPLKKSPRKEMH